MTQTLTHFIGGKQISAPGALESTNPSNTNEIIAKFPDGSTEDVNNAWKPRVRPSRAGPAPRRKSAPTCWTRSAA